MKNKYLLIIIILAIGTLGYYLSLPRLKPLPTKENPTKIGLYANVPLFDVWTHGEKKNTDNLIYKVILPPVEVYVSGTDKFRPNLNLVDIYILPLLDVSSVNIQEYYLNNKRDFLAQHTEYYPNSNLGKYYAFRNVDANGSNYQDDYFILTKKSCHN